MGKQNISIEITINGKDLTFDSLSACAKFVGVAPATITTAYKACKGNRGDISRKIEAILEMQRIGKPCKHPGCENRTKPGMPKQEYCPVHSEHFYRAKRAEARRQKRIARKLQAEKRAKKGFVRDPICAKCEDWTNRCIDIVVFGSGKLPQDKTVCFTQAASSLKTNLSSGGGFAANPNKYI